MESDINKSLRVLVVAGEDSGDAHAARLVEAITQELEGREIAFFGAAGSRMRDAGVRAVVDSDDFGIVGVPEVLRAVPMFLDVLNKLTQSAVNEKADLAILVDFPEFNLKLAKRLKKKGIRVVYYISPQLWAWRSYRSRGIEKYVDLLLAILPFEKEWYARRGIEHVEYVGNPLTGKVKPRTERTEFRKKHGFDPQNPLVALLPGSRRKEIERILPTLVQTAMKLKSQDESIQFGVAVSASRSTEELMEIASADANIAGLNIKFLNNATYDLLNAADAAVVTSGTATLETALIGTPQVIVYRTSSLNFALLNNLVSAEQFGLPNIIAGKPVFKELLQNGFTADSAAAEVERLLSEEVNRELRSEAAEIANKMGSQDSSILGAQKICTFAGWKA